MTKGNITDPHAVSPREVRYLRRTIRRLESFVRSASEGVKVPKTPRNLMTLEERLSAHLEDAKNFDQRLWLADEIFGSDDTNPNVVFLDSPKSP